MTLPSNEKQRDLMLIINPIAGERAGVTAIDTIEEEAHKLRYSEEAVNHGASGSESGVKAGRPGNPRQKSTENFKPYRIDLRFTTHSGHATQLAREAVEKGYYGIIACGGDGTVNEAAQGVCGSQTALGIIPLGSGNGLARHLGVPMTIPGAFKVIAEDRILVADYATANGRPFFCTFGIGFDAEVTDKFSKLPGRGLKTYLRAVFEEYFRYHGETFTIISKGQQLTENALLVAVCNASQYGNNAYIAPNASIKDGLLDVTIIHHGNLLKNTIAAVEMLTGLTGKTAYSTTLQIPELKIIRKKDGAVHFDGEPATLDKEIDITCHHMSLRLFSTEKKQKMHAIMAPEIPFLSPIALTIRDLRFKLYNLLNK